MNRNKDVWIETNFLSERDLESLKNGEEISVNVDVDIDLYDVRDYIRSYATKDELEDIIDLAHYSGGTSEYSQQIKSVSDKMKYDFIMKHFDDLDLSDLENYIENYKRFK